LEEQLVLRLEVRVEGAAREPCALADGLDGCRVQAHIGKDVECGVEQAHPRVLAAAGPTGGVGHGIPRFTFSIQPRRSRRDYDTRTYPIHSCIGYEDVSESRRTTSGGLVSTLLAALGRWSYRHPWRVLVSWLL